MDYGKALAAPFIAGFAVQQGVELISSVLALIKSWDASVKIKKATLSIISIVISWIIVANAGLDVLQPFVQGDAASFTHRLTTIIFVSAGTEGFNSLLKWLSYKKEDAKASAAANKQTAAAAMQHMSS
jgi:hypothetical protein